MDSHQEIYDFILKHPESFEGINNINLAVNAYHKNPERWEREKKWVLTKGRKERKPAEDRRPQEGNENQRVTETVRRMKAMYAAGASVEEIAETVPNWIDDGPWDEHSVMVQLGLAKPRWQSAAEKLMKQILVPAS